eukprot:CAMPEP_0113534578 /NCGR_PEP_ID=MMETSP0015_2-20120614/5233_1 /TAXON_ID=2838 /ORGANISM="Odontella" /LENGTH=60 /DNA_ID=CAMNT_0000433747 /DNA_START=252 /DNA_END=430 /DNA_ORIENTATION=+ /assembly_acc=CAM_ASM_000160
MKVRPRQSSFHQGHRADRDQPAVGAAGSGPDSHEVVGVDPGSTPPLVADNSPDRRPATPP